MSTISSDKRKNDSNGTGSPIKYGLLVKVDFGSIDTKYLLSHSNITLGVRLGVKVKKNLGHPVYTYTFTYTFST